MINITENAALHINRICQENQVPKIRVAVLGGGCSGFNYHFDFAERVEEDDFEIGEQVVVDALSMQYLSGATLDFTDDLLGQSFEITNPNAQTTCGCGSSFSV